MAELGSRVREERFWLIHDQVPGMTCITPRAFALETAPLLKPLSCQAIACASDEETPSSDASWPTCEPLTWLAVGLGAAAGTTRGAGAGAASLALTAWAGSVGRFSA